MASLRKNTVATALGFTTAVAIAGAVPAVAEPTDTTSGENNLTLSLGGSAKDVDIELVDGSGKTVGKGVTDEKGDATISYGKVDGDIVTVKLGNKSFDMSTASCTTDGQGTTDSQSGDQGSTDSGSSEGSSDSSSAAAPTSDNSTEPTGDSSAPSTSKTSEATDTNSSQSSSSSQPSSSESPTSSSSETSSSAAKPASDTTAVAAADSSGAPSPSDSATPDQSSGTDGVTPGGTKISDLVEKLKSGDITNLSDLLKSANGGPLTKVVGGINDIVKLFGGYENVKSLVNTVGGPYAPAINSVISLMQSLGLDQISSDDGGSGSSDDSSSPEGSDGSGSTENNSNDSLDNQLNDIVQSEKALGLKTTGEGFSFNTAAGHNVDCKVAGMGSASDSDSDSTSSSKGGSSSSSTDSTSAGDSSSGGAKVDTGGSIETEVPQPSLWDRFLSLF